MNAWKNGEQVVRDDAIGYDDFWKKILQRPGEENT
jgi:hypothetical protein